MMVLLRQVMQGGALVVAGGLFLYLVSLDLTRYLTHPTTTTVALHLPPTLHLPPVLICPQQPFHLQSLKEMGLDLTAPSDGSLLDHILTLRGLDPSLVAQWVWHRAGLTLGQVVHSLIVGQVEERYSQATQFSPNWRRVTTPLGSCLALLLPPLTSHKEELPSITISLNKNPEASTCPISYYGCSPDQIQERCNSTCEFQEHLAKGGPMRYYVLLGRVYPRVGRDQDEELDEILRYLLAEDTWHTSLLSTKGSPLNVIQVDTTMVDRRPLSCDQYTRDSPGTDFTACVDRFHRKSTGCVPVRPGSNVTLEESCKVPMMQDALLKVRVREGGCKGPLEGRCHQRQWVHEVKHSLNMTAYSSQLYQVQVSLTSPKMRLEMETDMYPLSQLASDIGGSLGLCLGLSLLTMSHYLGARPHLLLEPEARRRLSGRHCQQLLYWSMVVSLALFTIIHGAISFHAYLTQPVRVSVKRVTTTPNDTSTTAHSIYDQVAARLASRALDCRPEPQQPQHQCVLDCLMKQALKQDSSVAPFLEVEDLPVCPTEHGWKYSPNYVVPSLAYTTATDPLLVKQCERRCEVWDLGAANSSPPALPHSLSVNHHYYYITVCDFLCSLGGIVSLYAGLFLTSAVPVMVRLLPDSSPATKLLRRVVTLALESFIYLSGATMTVLLFHRFIFDHPVSSRVSRRTLSLAQQPQVTLCHWPPFQHELMDNMSMAVDEAWAAGAWQDAVSRADITEGPGDLSNHDSDYDVTTVLTVFNRCNNVKAQVLYNNLMISFYYFLSYKDTVAVSLHGPWDPPFTSRVYRVLDLKVLTLTVVPVLYRRLAQLSFHRSPTYHTCLYTCLHNMYSDHLGCRLPFVHWRPELPLCSLKAAFRYPTWPEQNRVPPESMTVLGGFSTCHQSCRHLMTEFYLVEAGSAYWLESGVNVVQQRGSFVALEEVDWYPLLQLANDLGVVAGFTFGTSILSILQAIIQRWLPRYKPMGG